MRELAQLFVEADITEIEVAEGRPAHPRGAHRRLPPAAAVPSPVSVQVAPSPAPVVLSAAAADATQPIADHPGAVKSPMVGTAYLQAEPRRQGLRRDRQPS